MPENYPDQPRYQILVFISWMLILFSSATGVNAARERVSYPSLTRIRTPVQLSQKRWISVSLPAIRTYVRRRIGRACECRARVDVVCVPERRWHDQLERLLSARPVSEVGSPAEIALWIWGCVNRERLSLGAICRLLGAPFQGGCSSWFAATIHLRKPVAIKGLPAIEVIERRVNFEQI